MLTRRGFIAAGASTLAVLGPAWHLAAQGNAGVRRSVATMAANDPDLVAYRRAVAAMKALPLSDPRNWTRVSLIHRDFCPHGNWYFLPWHRAYLVSFERICRELSGKADFALPYWDWTVSRRLPAAFTAGDPRSNPLNHPRPGLSRTASLPEDMVGRAVVARILNSPDFEAFGSTRPRGQDGVGAPWQRRMGSKTELEFNPHDGVHTTLGGDMAVIGRASRDPIFFLHHANLDRLWSAWNNRGNANSPDANWRDFVFAQNFANPDGSPWNVAVGDLQSTPALGYRYEGEDGPFAADIDLSWAQGDPLTNYLLAYRRLSQDTLSRPARTLRRVELGGGGALYMAAAESDAMGSRERPVAIPVMLGRPLGDVLNPAALAAVRAPRQGKRERHVTRQCVWATMRDIEPPRDPNTRVRVFVNCSDLSPGTPLSDPSYVTSLSFFGAEHMMHAGAGGAHAAHAQMGPGGACVSVDLTPALARMSRTKSFHDDKIVVQMMPVCAQGDAAGSIVRPRRVEIAII